MRQPYRLEAAKAFPRMLAEAELLVSRLEDAMEFAKGGRDEGSQKKQAKSGDDSNQQNKKEEKNQGSW